MNSKINEIYLIKNIDIDEIFDVNEINELLEEKLFWSIYSNEDEGFNNQDSKYGFGLKKKLSRFQKTNLSFDKGNLIIVLLNIAIEKLKETNKVISKGLQWVKKELQETLLFSNGQNLYYNNNKDINNRESDIDYKNIISWIEDANDAEITYSNISKLSKNAKRRMTTTENMNNSLYKLTTNILHTDNIKTKAFPRYTAKFKQEVTDLNLKEDNESDLNILTNQIKPQHRRSTLTSSEKFILKYDTSKHLRKIKIYKEEIFLSISHCDFDIFKYETEVGRENVLSTLTFQIFFNFDIYSIIDLENMENFINKISNGYLRSNPYHHDLHAADVLQTCYSIIVHSNMRDIMSCNYIDMTSFLIAAIIHDYKHPGYTNMFLVNTKNILALTYNDTSVLENYHVAEAFKIIDENKNCNIFSMLEPIEYKAIRKKIIECVLSTDMTKHAHEYNYLRAKVESNQIKGGNKTKEIFYSIKDETLKNQTKQEFLNTLIHLADISNPTKPTSVYVKWADMVMKEFWLQGDKEHELGLPFSFLCDRNTTKLPAAQIGFMDGIVLPLTQIVVELFPGLGFMVDNILKNSIYYKNLKEEDK